jgi:hypothetical protein
LPQSTLGAPPQSTLEGEWPSVASIPAPRAAAPSGLSVFTTSKGVALERRVDASGNVQIDFPGGDPAKFSEPTVYERAKARLQAASALAPVAPAVAPMASEAAPAPAPVAPASSLGGPVQNAPAYVPPVPAPAPLPTWQPLAASPGYEAYGTVGPDGIWRYEPGSVRPMGGWAAQPAPVNYSAPAVFYAAPVYSMGGGASACGPYGCSVSGYGRPGLFGGLFRR